MKKAKYIEIYEDIKTKISNQIYLPTDQLPTDNELSDYYKVSLITVKNAMKKLSEERIVERISGKGTFVLEKNIKNDVKQKLSLIVPDFSEAFCLEIVNVFEKLCRENDYVPLISRSFGGQELEIEIIKEHRELGTNGIVIMPVHGEYFNQELLKLSIESFPLITIDRNIEQLPISYIGTDNKNSSQLLAKYLKKNNFNHPLIVTADYKRVSSISDRVTTFKKQFTKTNLLIYNEFIPSQRSGVSEHDDLYLQNGIANAISSGSDCIFCSEYNIASKVEHILTKLNSDLEIVCFDYPIARKTIKFTHVQQNQRLIAESAFENILKLQKHNSEPIFQEIIGNLVLSNI